MCKNLPYLILASLMLSTGFASAVEIGRVAGHEIALEKTADGTILKADGKRLFKEQILGLEDLTVISGNAVIIGFASPGGNACEGSPFILTLPKDAPVKFDGPIDTCRYLERSITATGIEFTTSPVPGEETQHWSWTPDAGLKQLAPKPFAPTRGTGWENLRERSFTHPADALQNAGIRADVEKLLGPRFSAFQAIITGTGSGKFEGDDFFGSACSTHMCGEEEAILYLSAADRRIYAAFKPSQEKIAVSPPVKEWPDKPRQHLKEWAAQWK